MELSILHRGPLTSCNYSCEYCPFAKRHETKKQLERDQLSLQQFADWLREQTQHRWRILFTPWGEALVRSWYRDVVTELSHFSHIDSVAVQTNLSCRLDWLKRARTDRVNFWATFHPTETDLSRFVSQVSHARERGAEVSVGAVAVPEFLEQLEMLRRELPADLYFWINAQQPRKRPYTPEELDRFTAIDPMFPFTVKRQPSLGKPCRTGEVTFTVDGNGDMRRCHFVDEVIGNIFDRDWEAALQPRSCPRRFCDCFLGKAQLRANELRRVFGDSLLERQAVSGSLKF